MDKYKKKFLKTTNAKLEKMFKINLVIIKQKESKKKFHTQSNPIYYRPTLKK